MRYFILFFALFFCCSTADAKDTKEFGEWYGIYDNMDNKMLIVYAEGEDDLRPQLVVYVYSDMITRIKFEPPRQIALVKFDHKEYRNMNYNSLFGYDPWVKRMIKHYKMQVWFVGSDKYEVFSLKGFSKAIRWLD